MKIHQPAICWAFLHSQPSARHWKGEVEGILVRPHHRGSVTEQISKSWVKGNPAIKKKYQKDVFEVLWLCNTLNKRTKSQDQLRVIRARVWVCQSVCVWLSNSLNPGSEFMRRLCCDRQHHLSDWCKAVTQDEPLSESAPSGVHALSGVRRNNQGFDC